MDPAQQHVVAMLIVAALAAGVIILAFECGGSGKKKGRGPWDHN